MLEDFGQSMWRMASLERCTALCLFSCTHHKNTATGGRMMNSRKYRNRMRTLCSFLVRTDGSPIVIETP